MGETSKLIKVQDREQKIERDDLLHDIMEGSWWDSVPCSICKSADPTNDHLALICDGCCEVYHTYCVGLEGVPLGEWYCSNCTHSHSTRPAIKYKDDLSDFDEDEELPLDSFSKPTADEYDEWVPDNWYNENDEEKEEDFGLIVSRKSKKRKKRKQRKPRKKKRRNIELDSLQTKQGFDSVGDIITDYQELSALNRKRMRREWEVENNDVDDAANKATKRRKVDDSNEGDGVLHDDPLKHTFFGYTNKMEGFQIVQDKNNETMFCFTFKKRSKATKKRMQRKDSTMI